MMRFKKDTHAEFIDVADLRVGHYIYLDVGWMGHPFALNNFRISSDDQIATIRSLGLERLRYSAEQSHVDEEPAAPSTGSPGPARTESAHPATVSGEPDSRIVPTGESEHGAEAVNGLHSVTPAVESPAALAEKTRLLAEAAEKSQRRDAITAQRASLHRCENQFNEAARSYRDIVESMHSQPLESKRRCEEVVDSMIGQMGPADEETLVRLLSEKAGERTSLHSINVSIISLLLAKAYGCSVDVMRDIGQGALLHDIGKMDLPDRLRWVDGGLTGAELALYKEHVGKGVQIARRIGLPAAAQIVIGQHHEHANGTGYPQALRGEKISLPARIVSLVNQYDNLCNPSNPAVAVTPHEALSLLYAQSKQNFDAKVLAVFIRLMGVYPPGSVIELSTGRHALVVSVNSTRPLRPNVLVHDPAVPAAEAIIVDLESCPDLGIRRSIKPVQLPKAAYDYLSPRKRLCYFFERGGEARTADLRNEH